MKERRGNFTVMSMQILRGWWLGIAILCALSGCGEVPPTPSVTVNATLAPTASGLPTATAVPGKQACPGSATAATFAALLTLDVSSGQVIERINCGDLKRDGQVEALVLVRSQGSGQFLDLYVYALKVGATPTPIFTLLSLGQGAAFISRANTIVVRAVDPQDCINALAIADTAQRPSWSQEFRWTGTAFAPTIFPGIYPASTRYDAEIMQQHIDAQTATVQDPVTITNAFFTNLLHYPSPDNLAALIASDANKASVRANGMTVLLQRLLLPGISGLWEVTGITPTKTFQPTSPVNVGTYSSPISVRGSGATATGQITATVLDHAGCAIGAATLAAAIGTQAQSFTATLAYTADSGLRAATGDTLAGTSWQEGSVWLGEKRSDGTYSQLQILKVLLG